MDQTRWLSEDEQTAWRGLMAATDLIDRRLDEQLQRDSGMPHAYYEILVRLSEAPGRALRMSALADRSQSSRSRLSHAVARLEANGWVRREVCESDKRGQIAQLTDAGFEALAAAAPGHVEGVRRHVFDPLTPEQVSQLGAISTALVTALLDEPESAECAQQALA
jgi:DNA-binding MarR family transcriptional regulator